MTTTKMLGKKMKLPEHKHVLVQTDAQLGQVINDLSEAKYISFDIETNGLEWWKDVPIVGMGIGALVSKELLRTYYIPTGHQQGPNLKLPKTLKALLANGAPKIGANIKFDSHFMWHRHGFYLHPVHDIQVLARLLRTDARSVALDTLMKAEFKAEHTEWKELQAWARKQKIKTGGGYVQGGQWHRVPQELLGRYCGKDVYWTLLLFFRFWYEIQKQPKLLKLYTAIEAPLLHAVMEMEEVGVAIDYQYLIVLKAKLVERAKDLSKTIYEQAGKIFDIASAAQLKEVLLAQKIKPQNRVRRKVQNGKEVRTESASFDKLALESYKDSSPLVRAILNWRQTTKFQTSYVDAIFAKLLIEDVMYQAPRLHFSLKQEQARTGRMSASEPNIQNLPRDNEEDEFLKEFSIRHAFLPTAPHCVLLSIDFANIELRLLAHFSKDPELIKIFKSGGDFHGTVAEVIGKSRAISKTFNFASLYGSGIKNLALKTGVSEAACEEIIEKYDQTFTAVAPFKRGLQRWTEKNGCVENPFGRKRVLGREFPYRAVNTLIQGTAADILKVAILRVSKYLRFMRSKLLFPVHDELVIDWDLRDGYIVPQLTKLMCTFEKNGQPLFRVPIEVEAKVSYRHWGEKKALEGLDIVEAQLSKEKGQALYDRFITDPKLAPWVKYGERFGFKSAEEFFWYLSTVYKCIKEGRRRREFKHVLFCRLKKRKGWIEKGDLAGMPELPWEAVHNAEREVGEVSMPKESTNGGAVDDGWGRRTY